MNILDYVAIGQENAISRRDLAYCLSTNDRTMRQIVELSRISAGSLNEVICNFQDGKGYFRAENTDDLKIQLAINRSRASSLNEQIRNMERILKDAE